MQYPWLDRAFELQQSIQDRLIFDFKLVSGPRYCFDRNGNK